MTLPPKNRAFTSIAAPLLFAVLLASSACRVEPTPLVSDHTAERVSIGGVLWYVSYEAGLEVAREQDKALWVHFGENPG